MAKFVSKERVPVTVEGDPNTIYIKPKMDYGTRNAVTGAATRISRAQDGKDATADFDMGAYNIALLTLNIVGWAGPDFDDVECTPDAIKQLDPDDPLLNEVLREINDRNLSRVGGKDGPSPNPSEPDGAKNSEAPTKGKSGSTTST